MTDTGDSSLPPPLNLLTDAWLPVRRRSGRRDLIRPAQIAEVADPVIDLDWPRADFRIASLEFLIGLLATAAPPEGLDAWLDRWDAPPDPSALDAAFAPLAHAFNLDGEGPRFMQESGDLVSDDKPIQDLLIDAAGSASMFTRHTRVDALGRHAAAMALFTLQCWAPEGGRGHFTGLRGGGPLSTFVLPGARPTIWQTVWANVQINADGPPPTEMLPSVLPWLSPAIGESGPRITTPENSHVLQTFWSMPRRIRLNFVHAAGPHHCPLTGVEDTVLVGSWRQRPNGVKYVGWGKMHPLTPHRQDKSSRDYFPLHGQPGGIGYRDWIGLVVATPEGVQLPASAVSTWRGVRGASVDAKQARLLAAGYDMKSMKARAFVESEMPLPAAPSADERDRLDALASRLVRSANHVAGLLRGAVRAALFSPGATVKLDAELLSSVRERLWEGTEEGFFALLTERPDDAERRWLARLREVALRLFDEAAPLTAENGGAAPRIGRARRNLIFALTGFGKDGEALFDMLGFARAQPKAKKTKGKAA
ncbi:type I-E CRISPR-associated protein Cse1/CasA [Falsiroseomonas sp. CW058]|uniref:type I-E CRISPR-associated protein Cse1/CasA n=1 Tax=Falsiroseomonas sp. CW058 TaxID=3388664 RepID=UPI003D31E2C4